jgi:hypothetical protein
LKILFQFFGFFRTRIPKKLSAGFVQFRFSRGLTMSILVT